MPSSLSCSSATARSRPNGGTETPPRTSPCSSTPSREVTIMKARTTEQGGAPAWPRRAVLILTLGYGLSMLGDELAVITLMLRTEHDSGSGWAVSAILLASFVPIVVAGPLLAPLIDRIDHVNLIDRKSTRLNSSHLG